MILWSISNKLDGRTDEELDLLGLAEVVAPPPPNTSSIRPGGAAGVVPTNAKVWSLFISSCNLGQNVMT